MTVDALCIRCRKPLNEDGVCPRCEPDEAAAAAKLRRLREEIARERGEARPARPRSRLWRRKKEDLEKARREAAAREEAETAGEVEEAGEPGSGARKAPSSGMPDDDSDRDETPAGPAPTPAGGHDVASADAAKPVEKTADEAPSSKVWAGASGSAIRARELDVTDPRHGSDAVQELLEHRRKGLGKIIGIAGLPRHGKTKLADRLRERYAERPGADLRYDKTERGEVNLYYVPGRREHHVLVDVAGEDFQALGDYERDLPALMRRFLWPVLQTVDGFVLLMALPIVWAGWNPGRDDAADGRADPVESDEIAMRRARERMIDAHRMLLKYAMVARDLKRLRRLLPNLGLTADEAPTRNQVDDAVPTARKLRAPVGVAFSKADLYVPGGVGSSEEGARPGLYTPDVPGYGGHPAPPLHPARTDPLILGHLHFPGFFDFLMERVKWFKFDFVQALVDRSDEPDPQEAPEEGSDAGRDTLLGAEAMVELVTGHPWWMPGLDTARAVWLDRKLRPERWKRDLLRGLYDPDGSR